VLSDGEEAIAYLDRVDRDESIGCADVILLDLNLPKRSGHWVLRRIRESVRSREVPVVIVSSSEAPADLEQSRQLGATAYFKKPTDLEQFLRLGEVVKTLVGE
jgi:CheY-like chemotaxis protein